MEVSVWWVFWAFIAGGYAGALVIGLLSVAGQRDGIEEREPPTGRGFGGGGVHRRSRSADVHGSQFSGA
jgi:hypothetical protein